MTSRPSRRCEIALTEHMVVLGGHVSIPALHQAGTSRLSLHCCEISLTEHVVVFEDHVGIPALRPAMRCSDKRHSVRGVSCMITEILVHETRHCEHHLAAGRHSRQPWHRVGVRQLMHQQLPHTQRSSLFRETLGLNSDCTEVLTMTGEEVASRGHLRLRRCGQSPP